MKRKGIPRKCIGPEAGGWERSIHKRHFKVTDPTLNAAESITYGYMSTSLCGIKEEKKEINNEKEVIKRQSSVIRCDVILNKVKDLIKSSLHFVPFRMTKTKGS